MMASFITRAIIMIVGYLYPAYECFKSVEKNRPDVEQLRFWCQYWMIIAVVTVLERLGDTFTSWLPMYNEAKLAFIIYLWYPKTKGTAYVYSTFLKPFVASHELEIDRYLNELKTRAGDVAFHYWQRGSVYAQSRFMELLQYVASQSPSSRPQQGPHMSQFQPPPPPPGYEQPASSNQPQLPPMPATVNYQPPASGLHTSNQQPHGPPPSAPPGYQEQLPGPSQRPGTEFEVADVADSLPVSEPVMTMPTQTRRRQRSRRQQ